MFGFNHIKYDLIIQNLYKYDFIRYNMTKTDLRDKDDIFIVEVTGTTTKTINVPKAVCEFCDLNEGDIVKIKFLEIMCKKDKKKNGK